MMVRHAEPAGATGATGPALSHRGQTQAAALAERLALRPVAALYTSPVARARETAEAVAARLGLPAQVQGLLGDSSSGGGNRGREAVEWLAAQHSAPDALVVAVTHLPIIRLALCHALGLDERAKDRFRVDPCAVTEITLGGISPVVALVNDTCHLTSLDA